jgi:P27 family predicted phage terminase small subunit
VASRRAPQALKVKLLAPDEAAAELVRDAVVGGVGLDFDEVPDVLDEAARAEWARLGEVYADSETRFREGDRAAVVAYCAYWSGFLAAAQDVSTNGPVVPGRSAKDRGRLVKNPATVAMRECATQLRYWARELGLTPDARGRIGVTDDPRRPDDSNPFAWTGSPREDS